MLQKKKLAGNLIVGKKIQSDAPKKVFIIFFPSSNSYKGCVDGIRGLEIYSQSSAVKHLALFEGFTNWVS